MRTQDEYEYVVVGSGAGGGPVAANLASNGHSVLVLEAGGPARSPDYEYQVPAFHALASERPDMSWRFFVRHYADDPQQRRDEKFCAARQGVFYPRAGTLGGCTAHNAMIFVYPSNGDWDYIAQITNDQSWSADNMRRYLERIEDCQYRAVWRFLKEKLGWNPSRHGFGGWLPTAEANPKHAVHDQALRRMVESCAWKAVFGLGRPIARLKALWKTFLDPNDWRDVRYGFEGIRLVPLSTRKGRRFGTRELLLDTQRKHPDKLEIRTGALATRVLFESPKRATGVEYMDGAHLYGADPMFDENGKPPLRRVKATREVILAAGAFNSPQILQLSGIGPRELLARRRIPVLVPLDGVGANLQDRYEVTVVNRMKRPFRMLEGGRLAPPASGQEPDGPLRQWIDNGAGIYSSNGAVLAILKKSSAAKTHPDLVLFGLVTDFRGYYPGYSDAVASGHDHFTWTILKGYTDNRAGTVAIRSCDPREVPDINFNYFDAGSETAAADLEAMADGVEFVRGMTALYPADLVDGEEVPGVSVRTREEIRRFIKDQAWGHHASCTCKIGTADDRMAVVDSNFRVHGTERLRVVDASVFPRIPGLFIVAAVYLVAEKASDAILADAR